MNILFNLPIIPILTFIAITTVFVIQFRVYLKQKRKERFPKVSTLDTKKDSADLNYNLKEIKTKPKTTKNIVPKNVKFAITIGTALFITLNIIVITYLTRNSKTTYLPRASTKPTDVSFNFLTPTVPLTPKKPKNEPTGTISPTVTNALLAKISITSKPSATLIPTMTPRLSLSPSPTPTPTTVPTPTITDNLSKTPLGGISNPTVAQLSPTSTLLSKNIITKTPTATKDFSKSDKNTADITETETQETKDNDIPKSGLTGFSIILLISSLALLMIGLII